MLMQVVGIILCQCLWPHHLYIILQPILNIYEHTKNLLFIPFLNLHNIKGKKVKYNFKMKSVKLTVFLSTRHFVI